MTRLGLNNLINNPIILGLFRSHEKVPIAILLNLILGLIRILGNISIQNIFAITEGKEKGRALKKASVDASLKI